MKIMELPRFRDEEHRQAEAAAVFAFEKSGGNVVGTLSGSLDLTGVGNRSRSLSKPSYPESARTMPFCANRAGTAYNVAVRRASGRATSASVPQSVTRSSWPALPA